MSLNLPAPGLIVTLAGFFGLMFLVNKLGNSGWGMGAVFALTGFMGHTLNAVMHLPNALGATAVAFLGLLAIALTSKRDFSFMGKFLMVGTLVAFALSLAVSGLFVLLMSGMILFETSRIVNGGETNYVLATVGLFVTVYNLFSSLLMLFGIGGNEDCSACAQARHAGRHGPGLRHHTLHDLGHAGHIVNQAL
jgi:modulator of FtsH protease